MKRRTFLLSASSFLAAGGIGALFWKRRWKYIVVHHSAGAYGDIRFLQQVHRERQAGDPIDAIPYHYVIGNGNGLKAGEVASDWRQEWGLWGSHVSIRNPDHNFRGIGICLIGNYEKREVPPEQYQSLVNLTRELMRRFDIEPENVTGHGMLTGESTKCPGKYFPMERFKRDIS
jgi:N-acetyl-anhydromuramyl-L-alanine amidase AmpD